MESGYVNNITLENTINIEVINNVIIRLFNQTKTFPNQTKDLYERIVELSKYYDITYESVLDIVNTARETTKIFPHTHNSLIRIVNYSDQRDEKDEIQVKRLYYYEVNKIVERMYSQLGRNCSDEDKIKWIYDYLYNLPFDINYPRSNSGAISVDSARINCVLGADSYKFGSYDKENLVLNREKKGVCNAFSSLFVDLCDFAGLDTCCCIKVSGKHMGVSHAWNAIINQNGLFFIDSSNSWKGPNSYSSQFMVPEGIFKTQYKEYIDYGEIPHSIKLEIVTNLNSRQSTVLDKNKIKIVKLQRPVIKITNNKSIEDNSSFGQP